MPALTSAVRAIPHLSVAAAASTAAASASARSFEAVEDVRLARAAPDSSAAWRRAHACHVRVTQSSNQWP
eukprot:4234219-Prymnesium_polylepis.1